MIYNDFLKDVMVVDKNTAQIGNLFEIEYLGVNDIFVITEVEDSYIRFCSINNNTDIKITTDVYNKNNNENIKSEPFRFTKLGIEKEGNNFKVKYI